MRNAVVTGGTGFIGSWLVELLLSRNASVYAIVRNKDKLCSNFVSNNRFTCIEKDITEVTPDDLEGVEVDCFYHLAWEGVSSDQKNNLNVQLRNIENSISMMELASTIKCNKYIAAGTVAEYAFGNGVMDFSKKQSPNDFYGAAKVSTHYFLDVLSDKLNMPYIWCVLPSTFGERREDNNIITYTIRSLLKGEKPDYGDLNQMWDFLYVSEVVRALYLVGELGKQGKTYGIGSGEYRLLKDYILTIRDMIDPTLSVGIGERKYNSKQLMSSCVDISELKKDTGFIPKVTFEEGIEKTINYIRETMK